MQFSAQSLFVWIFPDCNHLLKDQSGQCICVERPVWLWCVCVCVLCVCACKTMWSKFKDFPGLAQILFTWDCLTYYLNSIVTCWDKNIPLLSKPRANVLSLSNQMHYAVISNWTFYNVARPLFWWISFGTLAVEPKLLFLLLKCVNKAGAQGLTGRIN